MWQWKYSYNECCVSVKCDRSTSDEMTKRLLMPGLLALSWRNRPRQIALSRAAATLHVRLRCLAMSNAILSRRPTAAGDKESRSATLAGLAGRMRSSSRCCRPAGVVWDRKPTLAGRQASQGDVNRCCTVLQLLTECPAVVVGPPHTVP